MTNRQKQGVDARAAKDPIAAAKRHTPEPKPKTCARMRFAVIRTAGERLPQENEIARLPAAHGKKTEETR